MYHGTSYRNFWIFRILPPTRRGLLRAASAHVTLTFQTLRGHGLVSSNVIEMSRDVHIAHPMCRAGKETSQCRNVRIIP